MKFFDESCRHIFRKGDIRCWWDKTLCWLFHARKFWKPDWNNTVNLPVITCLKCGYTWSDKL